MDIRSNAFLRFAIRFSEGLNVELSEHDHPRLSTLDGCLDFLACHPGAEP